jgi:hypothetical protein
MEVNKGLIVSDTKVGSHKIVHEKYLGKLIASTKGILQDKPVMDGVITDTTVGAKMTNVPELHKVHHKSKTQATAMGQIPYAGPKY